MENFCKRLDKLLKKEGLSLNQAAVKIGIPRTTINSYFLRGSLPSVSQLNLIADYFGCTIDYLLGRRITKQRIKNDEQYFENQLDEKNSYGSIFINNEANYCIYNYQKNSIFVYNIITEMGLFTKNLSKTEIAFEKFYDSIYSCVDEGSKEDFERYFKSIVLSKQQEEETDVLVTLNDGRNRWLRFITTASYFEKDNAISTGITFFDCTTQKERDAVYETWKQETVDVDKQRVALFEWNLTRNLFERERGQFVSAFENYNQASFDERYSQYIQDKVFIEDKVLVKKLLSNKDLIDSYNNGVFRQEIEYREIDNNVKKWIKLTVQTVAYSKANDIKAFIIFRDIDVEKRAEINLINSSERDYLTGVYARSAFISRFEMLINKITDKNHALIMFDIDDFKMINDTFGHSIGDDLLKKMVRIVTQDIRSNDFVGRLGGDEFVVCLSSFKSVDEIRERVKQISFKLQTMIKNVKITASLGVAVFPNNGNSFKELYKNADTALYRVKERGKNGFAFFSDDINNVIARDEKDSRCIMVVSPEANVINTVSKAFSSNYHIIIVPDSDSFIKKATHYHNKISLIINDLSSEVDVMTLKINVGIESTPTLILTDSENNDAAINKGALATLKKPLNVESIKTFVDTLFAVRYTYESKLQRDFLLLKKDEESRFKKVLNATGTSVFVYNANTREYFADLLSGQHTSGRFDGRDLREVVINDGIADAVEYKKMISILAKVKSGEKQFNEGIVKLKVKSGEEHYFRMCVIATENFDKDKNNVLLISFNDVDFRIRAELKLMEATKKDSLTGIYNRQSFVELADKMIKSANGGYYTFVCFDIDDFKAINENNGSIVGDELLKIIAKAISDKCLASDGICCRVSADNFAAIYPSIKRNVFKNLYDKFSASITLESGKILSVVFSVGVVIIDDKSLSANLIYDMAYMAKKSVKGLYVNKVGYFEESMRLTTIKTRFIIDEMGKALDNNEFKLYFQPQYNYETGALVGAEALVRWHHPEKGIIPPNEFISIFEQNGFIYLLDKYVFKQACLFIKHLETLIINPLPISINISRFDILQKDFLEDIAAIISETKIDTQYIRVEITESAFANAEEKLIETVSSLRKMGLLIELDDFGSGYSSLNVLKDVPVDILKLDMKFIDSGKNPQRGGIITESVVRMARRLNMPVIAEGVETREQADFLATIDCNYVQGYLYARPMQSEEYKKLLSVMKAENTLKQVESLTNFNSEAFWDANSLDTLVFNRFIGGACVVEYHDEQVELLRVNTRCAQLIGNLTISEAMSENLHKSLDNSDYKIFMTAINKAVYQELDATCHVKWYAKGNKTQKPEYIKFSMKLISKSRRNYLIYIYVENETAKIAAEKKEKELSQRTEHILDRIVCGVMVVSYPKDRDKKLIFANKNAYRMFDVAEGDKDINRFLNRVNNSEVLQELIKKSLEEQKSFVSSFICSYSDGSEKHYRCNVSLGLMDGENVLLFVISDITNEEELDRLRISMLDNMPCGAIIMDCDNNNISFSYTNSVAREMFGYSENEAIDTKNNGNVDGDFDFAKNLIYSSFESGKPISYEIMVANKMGEKFKVIVSGQPIIDKGRKRFYATIVKKQDKTVSINDLFTIVMKKVMASSTKYAFVKDKNFRYVCCTKPFVKLVNKKDESEILGKTDFEIFEDKSFAEKYYYDDLRLLSNKNSYVDYIEKIPSNDNIQHYSNTSKYVLFDTNGDIAGIYGVGYDVTDSFENKHFLDTIDLLIKETYDYVCIIDSMVGDYNLYGSVQVEEKQGAFNYNVYLIGEAASERDYEVAKSLPNLKQLGEIANGEKIKFDYEISGKKKVVSFIKMNNLSNKIIMTVFSKNKRD